MCDDVGRSITSCFRVRERRQTDWSFLPRRGILGNQLRSRLFFYTPYTFLSVALVVSHRPDLDSGAGIAVVPSDPLNVQTVMTSRYAFFIYQEDISDWLPLPSLLGDAMERSDMASVFIGGNIYSFYQQAEKQVIEFKQDNSNVDVVTEVPVRQ